MTVKNVDGKKQPGHQIDSESQRERLNKKGNVKEFGQMEIGIMLPQFDVQASNNEGCI